MILQVFQRRLDAENPRFGGGFLLAKIGYYRAMPTLYDDELPQQSSRLRLALWGFAGFLLLLPAIAMQITHEVNWGAEDFLAAALLIGGTGLGVELAARFIKTRGTMFIAIAFVVLVTVLIWAELAVGILD